MIVTIIVSFLKGVLKYISANAHNLAKYSRILYDRNTEILSWHVYRTACLHQMYGDNTDYRISDDCFNEIWESFSDV